jgi:hypothetical protein
VSSNLTKSVYVKAKFIKYDKYSDSTSFGNQGSDFVFQDNFWYLANPELFSTEASQGFLADQFYDNLMSSDFSNGDDARYMRSTMPNYGERLDLSRIYINLERDNSAICLNSSDPLNGLKDKEQAGSGRANAGNGDFFDYTVKTYEGIVYNYHSYKLANLPTSVDPNFNASLFPPNTLQIIYQKCLVSSFRFKHAYIPSDPAFYKNLIVIESVQRQYIENFTDNFYYSQVSQKYYLNEPREELAMEICTNFFPTLALNDLEVIHGKVIKNLIQNSDPDLEDLSESISEDFYPDLCASEGYVALLNTMSCHPLDIGFVLVNYQGTNYSFDDQLICPIGQPAKTVMAVIRLAHVNPLVFYKDFSAETVPVDIYAYNFRNIDYVNVNQIYTSFISNGSVQSATTIYKAQALDLSKYLAVTLDTSNRFDEKVTGFTFAFKVYKVTATDVDALDYFLDIPITAKKPKITSLHGGGINGGGYDKLLIVTGYATRIVYYFNDPSSGGTSVDVTDTTDGTSQRTEISLVGKSGILYFTVYNYFHNFNGAYSESRSFEITSPPVIPIFQFRVYRNGILFNFRDERGNIISFIEGSNYTQDSFGNYLVASDYSDVTYGFKLTFTLPTEYSEMWLKIGSLDAKKITSAEILTFNKADLYKLLGSNGKIEIVALLQNKTPFIIPFTFFNYTDDALLNGSVTQQLKAVLGTLNPSATFSFNYDHASEIEYRIVNESNTVLYGPISQAVTYSTTSELKDVQTSKFSTSNGWSSLTAIIRIINRGSIYPHNKAYLQISTASFANTFGMLSRTKSAEVEFYSDSAKAIVPTIVNRGEKVYAFLQLYDFDNSKILVDDYLTYISTLIPPKFELIESDDDNNLDLEGVTLVRDNDYFYYFTVNADSPFDDLNLVLKVSFESII